jgi:hypothetical protein
MQCHQAKPKKVNSCTEITIFSEAKSRAALKFRQPSRLNETKKRQPSRVTGQEIG